MTRPTKTLVRYGLPSTDAVREDLATVGLAGGTVTADRSDDPDDPTFRDAQVVLIALSRCGRPELALRQLAALVSALRASTEGYPTGHVDPAADLLQRLHEDPSFRARLLGLLGGSETLGDHLVAHPHDWAALRDDESFAAVTARESVRSTLTAAIRPPEGLRPSVLSAVAPLRRAYRTQLAVIAAADLASAVEPGSIGPDIDEVCQALTCLADALLATTLDLASAAHPAPDGARLAVIAMGKCGATELNYVSDVDVLFVAGRGSGTGGDGDDLDQPALQALTAQATELMRICELVAWEVDAGLRPEGRNGPLVRTLAAYRAYYERWAKTWEFQALLKARPAAGDAALAERFMTMADAQVWTAAHRESFVTDVQAMRRRVEDAVPMADRSREFKLGAGGLRDVEFAVQLLQLVHGRADETLRVAGTLAAIRALTAGGYVGRPDGAELADSYAFQRRVEHLLQLQHLRRTHSLPASDDDLEWLARADGYATSPRGTATSGQRLAEELARHSTTVRRLHEKLFYRPLLAAVAAVPTDELRLTPQAAANRLAALGFAAPEPALRHLAALTDGVSRRAAIQRTLLPVLLGTFADAPDPDAGLLAYRQVSDALATTPWFLRLLRDEGLVAQRLASLLGTSRLVADLLQRAPEVLRLLVHDSALVGADADAGSGVAGSALQVRAARAADAWGSAQAARSSRRHEMLRLACADLLGLADISVVTQGLTSIADAVVRAALQAAYREVVRGGPDPNDPEGAVGLVARVAVIGMGRFGGAEMGYASDADVLFVVEPAYPEADPATVMAQGTAIAELTVRLLGRTSPDPPLDIDADLRPEGRGGPLVRTVESYRQYWERNIQPWERQALLRARAVAGDDDVTQSFLAMVDVFRYPADGLSAADAREIRRIKARVDAERLPRGADPALHTKLGRGALSDVEWTVQLLQLRHAGECQKLRCTSTVEAIAGASEEGYLDDHDAVALREAWLAATRARNAIMLVTGKSGDEIPTHGKILAGIARACGYASSADPGTMVDDYRRATRRARRVVERLFDGEH